MYRNLNFPVPAFFRMVFIFVLMMNGLMAQVQYTGFKPVDNLDVFKSEFMAGSAKIHSIKSDFTQEKILEILAEKITSEGKFWFQRSDKVRIEYEKPFKYLMIMNQDQLFVRDDQKENTINVRSNKLFQQVNRIMMDAVQGTILDNKDFSVKAFENNDEYLLEMIPVAKGLKDFFQTVLIFVDRNNYSINCMEMREKSGDKTIMQFTKKELNAPLKDEVFVIR